jgi:hypothetical protein
MGDNPLAPRVVPPATRSSGTGAQIAGSKYALSAADTPQGAERVKDEIDARI